jgi:hypothetical protein
MPRPNLFIIGAAKCGTTSLHDFLALHPDVFMSEPKEPGYFAPEVAYYPREEAWYLDLFRDAGDALVVGESSTHYTKLPLFQGVPARIAAWAPEARLIYLMRDPVKRAISHYWHNLRKFEERRPLLAAMRERPEYVAFGDYRMQIEAYLEHFSRERLLLLTFEEMVSDPATALEGVLTWLGLGPMEPLELPASNVRPEEIQRLRGRGMLWKFAKSRTWERLHHWVPQVVKELGREMAIAPADVDRDQERRAEEYLRPIMREKVAALSELLGRDFPAWTGAQPPRASR